MSAASVSDPTATYMEHLALSAQGGAPQVWPLMAGIAINAGCNSRCSYCWSWKEAMDNTPLADLRHAVDELAEVHIRQIHLAGGEPFLHPDLPELVGHIQAKGLFSAICTNGTFLSSERYRAVADAGLQSLTLSLDTMDPQTYQYLRGIPLAPIWKSFTRLLEMRDRYPTLGLGIGMVLSRANIDHVIPAVEFAHTMDFSIGIQPLHAIYYGGGEAEHLMCREADLPRLHALIARLIEMKRGGYPIANPVPYLEGCPDYLVYRRLPKQFRCTAGFSSIIINPQLDVRVCAYMEPVGNLRRDKMLDLWMSDDARRKRGDMLNLRCTKCWQRCETEVVSEECIDSLVRTSSP